MKLINVFEAREAWQHLVALKIPAHTAYRLMKYGKMFSAEYEIVDQKRNMLIKEYQVRNESGKLIDPTSEAMSKFALAFREFLSNDSELAPFDTPLSSIIDLAAKEPANTLSVRDLLMLEPFFKNDTQ